MFELSRLCVMDLLFWGLLTTLTATSSLASLLSELAQVIGATCRTEPFLPRIAFFTCCSVFMQRYASSSILGHLTPAATAADLSQHPFKKASINRELFISICSVSEYVLSMSFCK